MTARRRTAEDVAFSIELYKDTPDFPYLPSYATYFIEATDATTVTLTTKHPIGNFEAEHGLHVRPAQAHLGGRGGMSCKG